MPVKKLPIDVGVIVLNVGTCAAIADAVIDGKPLISRITTVTGCVRSPANLRLRIGTIAEDVIGACGGFSDTPGKIAFGGGMTGLCLPNIYMPMAKSTNGIVVYNEKDARSVEEGPCIRCGHCVAVCPIGLNPYQMKVAADADKLTDAASLSHMMNANTFTAGAFHVASSSDVDSVVSDLKDNIMNRQWMCGFPDKLVVITMGQFVVSVYGAEDLVDTFRDKLQNCFSSAAVVYDDPIA